MHRLILAGALLLAVWLSGCAGVPAVGSGVAASPLAQIAAFTVGDLTAADADAVVNNDEIAHACYPALIKFIQALPQSGGTVSGAFSAFQKARDVGNAARAGVPVYLMLGCGPLVVDSGTLLTKLAAIGGGVLP